MHWTVTLGILFALPSPGNMWNKPFISGKAENKSEQYSKWLEEKMCGSCTYFTLCIKGERDWVCNPHLWNVMALLWVANYSFQLVFVTFFPLAPFIESEGWRDKPFFSAFPHQISRPIQPWKGIKITH